MLFRKAFLEAIARGEVTLAFRRWQRPSVKAGGTLKTSVGVLAIDRVEACALSSITSKDARSAGFESRQALVEELQQRTEGQVYRIEFRLAGEDPRIALREDDQIEPEEMSEILAKLARKDRASKRGACSQALLELLDANPAARSAELYEQLGYPEQLDFKRDVRKLKNLGLTVSLGTGYQLSPRGKAVLAALRNVSWRATLRMKCLLQTHSRCAWKPHTSLC